MKWSGRKDLNLRPPGPEPGALARLRYAPTATRMVQSTRELQLNTGAVAAERPFALKKAHAKKEAAGRGKPPGGHLHPPSYRLERVAGADLHDAGLALDLREV